MAPVGHHTRQVKNKKKWQLHGQETQDTHAPNHGTEKSMSVHFFSSLSTTITSGRFSATPRLISLFQKSSILPLSLEHTVLGTWLNHLSSHLMPYLRQSSQWILDPILSCLMRYCFFANSLQLLIM